MYQTKIMRDKERISKTSEVFTPDSLVEEMLDNLGFDWSDPNKKILEPSFGNGNFLVAILDRLMNGLTGWQPDLALRHKHIIENMIYGVELMKDNVEETIERLNCKDLQHHLICGDSLNYHFRFDEYESKNEEIFIWPEK